MESGGEHKLSGDIALSETVSVSEGKTVVLDLNGHNLTSAANAINVPATSTLTVKDSAGQGTISGNNSGTGIENSGTLIIEGGVIQKFGYAINNKGEGDVTISGGHFASQIYSDDASGAKVIIKGGTFSSIDYCLDWVADGYEAVNNSGTWTVVEKNS